MKAREHATSEPPTRPVPGAPPLAPDATPPAAVQPSPVHDTQARDRATLARLDEVDSGGPFTRDELTER